MTFPQDDAALEAEVGRQQPAVARAWAAFACEAAVDVWNRCASRLSLSYRDSVVGSKHHIAPSLPERALAFLARGEGEEAALCKEYREPLTAIQDDDWSLPEMALSAFRACDFALKGRYALAIIHARHATFQDVGGDRARFDAIWLAWWQRCQAAIPPATLEGRLPGDLDCRRFLELAQAIYAELGVGLAAGSTTERELVPRGYEVEAEHATRWSDGVHTAEVVRIWDRPVAFQSRDRAFEACMSIPEHRATIRMSGMDDLYDYRLEARPESAAVVRSAIGRAARRFGIGERERTLVWRCLEQRGFEPLGVTLPDTREAGLVALARRVAAELWPDFSPTPSRSVIVFGQHEDLGYGEYYTTTETVHGDPERGFRVVIVGQGTSDAAGPSDTETDTTLEALGLPEGRRFELRVKSRPAPFRDAGITVEARLVADERSLRRAETALNRVFRDGQVSE